MSTSSGVILGKSLFRSWAAAKTTASGLTEGRTAAACKPLSSNPSLRL